MVTMGLALSYLSDLLEQLCLAEDSDTSMTDRIDEKKAISRALCILPVASSDQSQLSKGLFGDMPFIERWLASGGTDLDRVTLERFIRVIHASRFVPKTRVCCLSVLLPGLMPANKEKIGLARSVAHMMATTATPPLKDPIRSSWVLEPRKRSESIHPPLNWGSLSTEKHEWRPWMRYMVDWVAHAMSKGHLFADTETVRQFTDLALKRDLPLRKETRQVVRNLFTDWMRVPLHKRDWSAQVGIKTFSVPADSVPPKLPSRPFEFVWYEVIQEVLARDGISLMDVAALESLYGEMQTAMKDNPTYFEAASSRKHASITREATQRGSGGPLVLRESDARKLITVEPEIRKTTEQDLLLRQDGVAGFFRLPPALFAITIKKDVQESVDEANLGKHVLVIQQSYAVLLFPRMARVVAIDLEDGGAKNVKVWLSEKYESFSLRKLIFDRRTNLSTWIYYVLWGFRLVLDGLIPSKIPAATELVGPHFPIFNTIHQKINARL